MSYAAGFDKHKDSIANAVGNFLQRLTQKQAMDDYVKLVSGLNQRIKGRFQPSNKVQSSNPDGTQKPPETVDTNEALRLGQQDIGNFIIQSMGNQNISPDVLSKALTGLNTTLSSFQKPKRNLFQADPTKDVYDENTGELISKGEDKPMDFSKIFDGNSEKGYWKNSKDDQGNVKREWIANPDYKPEKTGGNGSGSDGEDRKDHSKTLGKLREAITKLRGIKTAKQDPKTKLFKIPDPNNLGFYDATQEELTGLKEQFKRQYVNDAVTLIQEQGLQSAVEDVRAILDKTGKDEKNLQSALNEFMRINPDYDATDRDILDAWFTFFLQ